MSQVSMSNVPDTRLFRFLFVGRIRQMPSNDGSGNLNPQPKEQAGAELSKITVEFIREYGALPTKACHLLIEYPFSHFPLPADSSLRGNFKALFSALEKENQAIIIVVNRWDGLTTDTLLFLEIFWMKHHLAVLLVYASDPPTYDNSGAKFYNINLLHVSPPNSGLNLSLLRETNLTQICLVFLGRRSEKDLDPSTRVFLKYFRVWPRLEISLSKTAPHNIYGPGHRMLPVDPPIPRPPSPSPPVPKRRRRAQVIDHIPTPPEKPPPGGVLMEDWVVRSRL